MPEENDPTPAPPLPDEPTLLGNLPPDELFVRAMRTVKMTSGAAGTWQPPSIEEAAHLFPHYEVTKLLGRGGMGAVYQARQIELDRPVAIKLLPLEISVDKDFADRFRREARAMAKLNHPHIIAVHDFGQTSEGHLFFVMEYVEGANLQDIIHQGGSSGLNAEQALSIVEQVCTALAYAHGKGIVHRDIKPANVMIDTESHVKVADFGLARLTDPNAEQMGRTMTGTVMGTPDYMAPEQMKGMNVDHRADIYSLGVMLYEMLCREVPKGFFQPPSERTGCDARIDEIVMKAMHQAPDHRYQTTTEMKSDVIAARTPTVIVPTGPTQVVHPRPITQSALSESKAALMKAIAPSAPRKSRLLLFAAVGVVLLALIGGALFFTKPQPKRAKTPSDKATSAASAALEPGAIKLWDAPEKIPKEEGKSWENGSLRLDHHGISYSTPVSRDAVMRASIRTNPEAQDTHIGLRGRDNGDFEYSLILNTLKRSVELQVRQAAKSRVLKTWLIGRACGPDEWVQLEFRAVGDEFTASFDGHLLGTVRDATIPEPGVVVLHAKGTGYFRDIIYVPLDKPDVGRASPP